MEDNDNDTQPLRQLNEPLRKKQRINPKARINSSIVPSEINGSNWMEFVKVFESDNKQIIMKSIELLIKQRIGEELPKEMLKIGEISNTKQVDKQKEDISDDSGPDIDALLKDDKPEEQQKSPKEKKQTKFA